MDFVSMVHSNRLPRGEHTVVINAPKQEHALLYAAELTLALAYADTWVGLFNMDVRTCSIEKPEETQRRTSPLKKIF
jgi:hypothetical protein